MVIGFADHLVGFSGTILDLFHFSGIDVSNHYILGTLDLEDILSASQRAKETLNLVWKFLADSPLLSGLISLARSLCVVALIFYSYQIYRKLLDDMDYRHIIYAMIPALLLIIILGNPSAPNMSPVWQIAVQFRNMIYKVDETIMNNLISGANLSTEIRVQQIDNYLRSAKEEVMAECNKLADEDEKNKCINEYAIPRIERLILLSQSAMPGVERGSKKWDEKMRQAIDQIKATGSVSEEGGLINTMWSMVRGIPDSILDALGFLIRIVAVATNYVIECGFVIASILGPLAAGLSLFPLGQKPIFVWLLGYLSLGIWKISSNILAGLGAFILNRTDDYSGFNYMIFAVITGIFAPAIGASMGTWSASQMAQNVGTSATRAAQGAVTGGVALAVGGGYVGAKVGNFVRQKAGGLIRKIRSS